MIIFLDTQTSSSSGANVANENWSREIMELFSMGVDNGYDQNDITQMAPCWTGWRCQFTTNPADYGNAFAIPKSAPFTNQAPGPDFGAPIPGVWQLICLKAAGRSLLVLNHDG